MKFKIRRTESAPKRPKPPICDDLEHGELFMFAEPEEGEEDRVFIRTDEDTVVDLGSGIVYSGYSDEEREILRVKHKPIEFEIIPNP